MASSSSYNSPCAACKFLRRKCMPGCTFAPYFPPEDPQKFVNVHRLFGASNVTKLLNEVLPNQREDVVNSLAYEAEARVRDPVYGCVGVISMLETQIDHLQKDLNAANADLVRYAGRNNAPPHLTSIQAPVTPRQTAVEHFSAKRINGGGGGGGLYLQPPPNNPYANREWNWQNAFTSPGNISGSGGGNGGDAVGLGGGGNVGM